MKLLIDFSNLLYGSFFTQLKQDFEELNDENRTNFIKYLFLTRLIYFKNKFQTSSKDIIICCDHKIVWRKNIFSFYKENRKRKRESSDIDFEFLFKLIEEFYNDLKLFPFVLLKNKYMEGDDWIAIVSKYFTENKIEHTIISSDKDFLQLHSDYCFQFSPILNKFLSVNDLNLHKKLKILTGDVKDGIPNIFSDDDCLINLEKRQKRLGDKKTIQIISENDDLREYFIKSKLLNNFERNQKLIDFDFIPKSIMQKGLKLFLEYKIQKNEMDIMIYLNRRDMKNLEYKIDDIFR